MISAMSDLAGVAEYYKNPRPDVLDDVPKDARTVLDIGCATGVFGEAIKQRQGSEVWGIEFELGIGELARTRLDQVFIGDALQIVPTLPASKFDLMTCNDVLEHLVSPGALLQEARRVLTPKGRVLMSLPNIRYWDAFLRIARDADFPQEDSGIFDRTHLRFFTRKSIPRFLAENGYEIEWMKGINPTPSRKLRALNLVTANRFDDCRFLQFLILARPK